MQGTSAKGNGVYGTTASTSTTGNAGVLGSDATTSTHNTGVKGSSSKGIGVLGTSTSSTAVRGITSGAAPGVYGTSSGPSSGSSTLGAYGSSNNIGVGGSGSNIGVQGQGGAYGVQGYGTSWGVYGYGYEGVYGRTTDIDNGTGVEGLGGNYGVYGNGYTGVYGLGDWGVTGQGFFDGVVGANEVGNATAVLAQGNTTSGFLFRGNNTSSTDVFTVDNSGNGYFGGQVSATAFVTHAAARIEQPTATGVRETTYAAQGAETSIEHNGEATLVGGVASIRFEANFAAMLARGAPYMVTITAQGPTDNSLYVAQKTTAGFVVRENHNGKSTVVFDYRVVGRPYASELRTEPDRMRYHTAAGPIHGPALIRIKPHAGVRPPAFSKVPVIKPLPVIK
ncbi:MAG: hypothetical protein JO165_04295 [Candidatus Eremiobacteraeota bacterium]|nr:hypothetical protein [Candidatus Eremiobacteraeota bacterium]